jgi:predicted anti-sigma-YlaC factor YlaD
MTLLLTCKEFLQELSDYLDENVDAEVKARLEQHISLCPNCWVVCDTTKRTIKIYKGMEPFSMPPDVEARLMVALERKLASKKLEKA